MDDGGWAFPQVESANRNPFGNECLDAGGMTLRDYFAAAAMPIIGYRMTELKANWTCERIAKVAYEAADAMLEARK